MSDSQAASRDRNSAVVVVSLELRESTVTDCADVVFLAAAVAETVRDLRGLGGVAMCSMRRHESSRWVQACWLENRIMAPHVIFGFVIVLILGLAWVWDSAGQRQTPRYAAQKESVGGAPEPGWAVARSFLEPPLGLRSYLGIGIGIDQETSTREVGNA